MWVRLRAPPQPARQLAPVQALRQEPPPELRTNLQAQALVFARQR